MASLILSSFVVLGVYADEQGSTNEEVAVSTDDSGSTSQEDPSVNYNCDCSKGKDGKPKI